MSARGIGTPAQKSAGFNALEGPPTAKFGKR